MKKIVITTIFLSQVISVNAQKKKVASKPAASKTNVEKVSAAKGINENNYGAVIKYTNEIVSCLNNQHKEINDRDEYYRRWSDYFLDNKANSKNRVIYSPYIAYDLTKNNARCTKSSAPNFMEETDSTFYNENYSLLVGTFQKMALVWNDMASFSKPNIPNTDYGKKKCEELRDLLTTYYETSEKLSIRNKELQKELFPFSVAKSPYKTAYIYLRNDMDAITDFVTICSNANNLKADSIKNALAELDASVTEHLLYANEHETPSNYKSFYDMANNSIVLRIKAKLNGKGLEVKDIEQLINNYNDGVVPAYNRAMN